MADPGLCYTGSLPLQWRPLAEDNDMAVDREALLLLTAINRMEAGHETESMGEQHRLERLEAKLDLALYLVARGLQPGPAPAPVTVRLSPAGIDWQEAQPPPAGACLLMELWLSNVLPLPLRLRAVARGQVTGWAQAAFPHLPEALTEALYQLIFRRHRQAIRSRQASAT
ncbi:MAG TPA: PilZ domain-containing protein [Thiobacillaceae bacterium]|nr:PilZ domain-containing protein [Thiobacillaceae bacterium]HNU63471.1 PilZ domain-containing protein [Thiobacillaceae bacterium]